MWELSFFSKWGNVYSRIVTERVQKITDIKIGGKQGMGRVDQIFNLRTVVFRYTIKEIHANV